MKNKLIAQIIAGILALLMILSLLPLLGSV